MRLDDSIVKDELFLFWFETFFVNCLNGRIILGNAG